MARFQNIEDSPAARHPEYLSVKSEWDYLSDIYQGITAWSDIKNGVCTPSAIASGYLFRHPAETPAEYGHRFALTEYPGSFQLALNEYVDLMFADGITVEASESVMATWGRLTPESMSGDVFLPWLALQSLLFGVYHVFVDFEGDRPIWKPISPRQLINWEIKVVDGFKELSFAAIETLKSPGVRELTHYYSDGRWEKWLYSFDQESSEFVFGVPRTGVLEFRSKPATLIPLVSVRLTEHGDMITGDRPFRRLADKTKALYNVLSDYRRKMKLSNTPVPVLYDPLADADLTISPNRVLRLSGPDCFFMYTETSVESLEASRTEMLTLQTDISRESASFLKTPTSRVSAGATNLSTVPLQASLFGFSRNFVAAISKIFALHQKYIGDSEPVRIEIVPSVKEQQAKDSQFAFAAQSLYDANVLTRHSTVKLLEENRYVSDEIAAEELKLPEDISDDKSE